jgi:hydroxymethylglutaryl-CoA synthase
MAKKAHRHLIDIEHEDLVPEDRERIFEETFKSKVDPGLLGAREVGNIYTGSVYMGLISLLENEKETIEGKQVGIFSYGSGCGAEFFQCHMKTGIRSIIEGLQFKEQLERRKSITFEQYKNIYSENRQEIFYHPIDVEALKNYYTRFAFMGFEDHKRKYG